MSCNESAVSKSASVACILLSATDKGVRKPRQNSAWIWFFAVVEDILVLDQSGWWNELARQDVSHRNPNLIQSNRQYKPFGNKKRVKLGLDSTKHGMNGEVVLLPQLIDQLDNSRGSSGSLLTGELLWLQIRVVVEEKLQEKHSYKAFRLNSSSWWALCVFLYMSFNPHSQLSSLADMVID